MKRRKIVMIADNNKKKVLYRAEVYYANLPKKFNSSIQGGYRPIVIWSNDKNNRHSTVYNYYAITSKDKKSLPVHVKINPEFLEEESTVICEQPRSDDEKDLFKYIDWEKGCVGKLTEYDMYRIFIGSAIQSDSYRYIKNLQYATA
jgi:mRNA-degrading endonuclease toxin of MazEF toxin-antitoxin module